jgi:hypothetical protein
VGSAPSDPDRQAWIARLRQRSREQRDELLAAPPFAVFGLAAPPLHPFVLHDFRRDEQGWHAVVLCYGDRLALAGPFVSVTTAAPRHRIRRRRVDRAVRDAVDAERRRHAEASGVEWPEVGTGSAELRDVRIRVDGRPLRARQCLRGDLWSARLAVLGRIDVTVAARGVRPSDVRLVVVDSLVPYWHGREELYGLPFGS